MLWLAGVFGQEEYQMNHELLSIPQRHQKLLKMGGTINSWDFFKQDHAEPGNKKVLGKVIPAGKGGLRKLTDFLAAHEHTIKHISFKLAQHFVSDNPSQSDVDFIANAWRNSNGNSG